MAQVKPQTVFVVIWMYCELLTTVDAQPVDRIIHSLHPVVAPLQQHSLLLFNGCSMIDITSTARQCLWRINRWYKQHIKKSRPTVIIWSRLQELSYTYKRHNRALSENLLLFPFFDNIDRQACFPNNLRWLSLHVQTLNWTHLAAILPSL